MSTTSEKLSDGETLTSEENNISGFPNFLSEIDSIYKDKLHFNQDYTASGVKEKQIHILELKLHEVSPQK